MKKIFLLTLTCVLSTTLCFAMGNRPSRSSGDANAPQQVSDTNANAQANPAGYSQGSAANNGTNVPASSNPSGTGIDNSNRPGAVNNGAPASGTTDNSRPGGGM